MAYSSSHGTVNNRPHIDSDEDDKFERDLKEILSEGSNSNNHSNSTGHSELGSGMGRVGGSSSSAATGQAYRPHALPPGTHSATIKSSVIAPGSLYCDDVICSLVDNNINCHIYERISVLTKSDSMMLNC